jgi:hypothetical protein
MRFLLTATFGWKNQRGEVCMLMGANYAIRAREIILALDQNIGKPIEKILNQWEVELNSEGTPIIPYLISHSLTTLP